METTKNNLPENVKNFFNDLRKYLDTKLLFYGSVQRSDYFPESSDIDVDIFTDNVGSTMSKML
jgi:predicted nucleotidyltransferase